MSRRRAAVGGWAGALVVAAVVWLGANGLNGLDQALYRRLPTGRNRYATEQKGRKSGRTNKPSEANTACLAESGRITTELHTGNRAANTDELSKTEVGNRARITQLVHENGLRLANLDRAPARDNKGPRAARLTQQGTAGGVAGGDRWNRARPRLERRKDGPIPATAVS